MKTLLIRMSIICLIASFVPVHAATVLEEVVVTAQKREQSLQDVAISITALDSGQIRDFRFVASTDVVAQAPNVYNFSTQGRGANAATYIRGVGLSDFGDAHETPVAGYIDEFYMLPPSGLDFALYDLERVEVLRGPQGTLFGRNTTGGLIHFITKKPSREAEGYIDATYASYDEVRLEGMVNAPAGENLAVRASMLFHDGDGYVKNLNPQFKDGTDYGTKSGRVQLLYTPTEDLEILAKVQYGDINVIPLYTDHEIAYIDPATGLQHLDLDGVDTFGFNERQVGAEKPRTVYTDNPQEVESEVFNWLIRVDWDMPNNITLTSLTGYAWVTRDNLEDCDGAPHNMCTAGFPVDQHIWTQEARLYQENENFRWTAGFYYLNQDAEAHPTAAFFGLPAFLDAPWELNLDSWSIFGHIEYDVSPQVAVLAGVRYTNDDKRYEAVNTFAYAFRNAAGNFVEENVGDLVNRTDELISANLELHYKPRDNWLFYGKVVRGTKAGGFNNGFYNVPTPEDVQFGDETLWSYEGGFKIDFFDRRARMNTAVFYYDYNDFQAFNWTGLAGSVTNADAENYGAEIEIQANPSEPLELSLGIALLETKIEDINNGTITRDVDMGFAPNVSFNGSASFTQPMMDGSLTLHWDFMWSDNQYRDNFNNPSSDMGEHFVTNARLTYKPGNERWEASFFAQNFTDETNLIKADGFLGFKFRQGVYNPPRWFGGTIRVNFL